MSEADSTAGSHDKRSREETQNAKSLLDVVEEEYPEKVGGLFGGLSQIGKLFTIDDWLNILTRSRSSLENAQKDNQPEE